MLVTCPECGVRVSVEANPCPNCGLPRAGERSKEYCEFYCKEKFPLGGTFNLSVKTTDSDRHCLTPQCKLSSEWVDATSVRIEKSEVRNTKGVGVGDGTEVYQRIHYYVLVWFHCPICGNWAYFVPYPFMSLVENDDFYRKVSIQF
jgi:hypothetical protein